MNPNSKILPLRREQQADDPARANPFAPFFDEIRKIVREELHAVSRPREEDRLLDAEHAAVILGVSEDWLYRHARKLPFARKLGPKMLRFSTEGIQKYLTTRKLP